MIYNSIRTGAGRHSEGTERPVGRRFARIAASIVCLAVLAATGSAQNLPAPVGFVNDFAGVVNSEDERAMTRIIEAIQRETTAEIAVVTVDTFAPYGSIDQYGIALAEAWGVGSAGQDNGVILILAVNDRRVKIEVGGGLEGAITDGTAGAILDDYVVPYFRDDRWAEGLSAGVAAIAAEIAEEYNIDLESIEIAAPQRPRQTASRSGSDVGRFIYYLIVFVFMISGRFFWPLLFMGRRRGFFGGGFGSSRGGGFSGGSGGFRGFGGGGFSGGGASRGF